MEQIRIEGSNDSPKIVLDAKQGLIFIGGSSLPENVLDIYNPVLRWLDEYSKDPNPVTTIDFFYDYLNTASSHMVMRMFEKIIELSVKCPQLIIKWHYLLSDLDMRDFGQELHELIHIPIQLIPEERLPESSD